MDVVEITYLQGVLIIVVYPFWWYLIKQKSTNSFMFILNFLQTTQERVLDAL